MRIKGLDDKIKHFLVMFSHIFLPKQVVQGCNTFGLCREIPCSEEMFGREIR